MRPDKVETNLYFSDDPVLQLFQLAPNSNFKIDLINGTTTYTGGIKLYWNLPNSQTVNWIITIDYFLQSGDNNVPSYKSIKVSDLTMSPGITIPSLPYTIGSIGFSHALEFNISTILSSVPGSPVLLGVRIKPLVADGSLMVPMGIVPDTNTPGTFPSQFRKIVAVVNSTSNVNTGTNKSPTPVLTLEYPISMPINPLLDYVYRGGEFIQR